MKVKHLSVAVGLCRVYKVFNRNYSSLESRLYFILPYCVYFFQSVTVRTRFVPRIPSGVESVATESCTRREQREVS